jgi:Tautomerase enzyme
VRGADEDSNRNHDLSWRCICIGKARSEILLSVGRSVKVRKKILADFLAGLSKAPGLNAENVMVCFKETLWENWSFGGEANTVSQPDMAAGLGGQVKKYSKIRKRFGRCRFGARPNDYTV